jgi:hypothetical protein
MPNLVTYKEALALVQELPGGPFETARAIREIAGALNAVTYENMACVVTGHDGRKLRRLVEICVPR